MTRRGPLWAGAALLLLSACTGSEPTIPLVDPASEPTDAVALVEEGVRQLRAANTGTLRSRADTGRRETAIDGVYRIAERAHRSEVTVRSGGDEARRTSILRQGVLYAELTDAAGDAEVGTTCWAVGRPPDLRRFDGTLDVADVRALPFALLAAGTAIGERLDEIGLDDVAGSATRVVGTLDLFYVLNVFGADQAADIGIEPATERVTATLRVSDGVLSGFTVTGADLTAATLSAGALLGAFPDEATIETDFLSTGRAVDLGLPPDERSFDVSQDAGLVELRDCLLDRSDSRGSVPIVFTAHR